MQVWQRQKAAAFHAFCRSRYCKYPGTLDSGWMRWNVEHQRRYSHYSHPSNCNSWPQGNTNTYPRPDRDLNSIARDNSDTYSAANTRDDANTPANTIVLFYASRRAARIIHRN
jgi:hypothetical protein